MPQDQRAVLELLYKVSREFATALDLKTVLIRVLFSAINNVGGERGTVVVLDDNGQAIDSAIVYGNELRESTTRQLKDTVDYGLAGWVVRNRMAVLVPDTSQESRWLRREDDQVNRSGAKSAICVPLMAHDKLVGVLTLVHPSPGAYDNDHFELMQAIADQAGIAVLNARLFSESQRQMRVMTALAEGAARLNKFVRIDDLFENIIAQVLQTLQVEIAILALVDGDELHFRAASDMGRGLIGKRVKIRDGIAGMVARQGRGVIIPSYASDTRPLLSESERLNDIKIRGFACVPIHVQDKVIGVLEAINPIAKSFDPDALLVLSGLGALAGTTIQNAQLFESLDLAQKRYHDLFEDSIDPIIITDLSGYILEVNKQVTVFSGHVPDALHNLRIDQIQDVNFEKTGQEFENIGESTLTYESTLHTSDSKTHPVQVYARKVIFDDSQSIQWILRDITERKELDTLREDMAAMIYHDLRSPLANILASVEMLDSIIEGPERDTAKPILRIAQHSISRIERMVSSLLDINRIEQNHAIGERQSCDVPGLVSYAVDAVKPTFEGREQSVRVSISQNVSRVMVDVDMIRRVLINLLENAAKYTPVGGKIVVGAEVGPEFGDGFLRLFVKDNGPGIPENEREHVFDKFIRLKNKTGTRGMGVGLAFCRLAVQGHGGRIWIDAADQGGSIFIFTLPIVKE